MPQASLLSYFSKSVTSTASLPSGQTHGEDEGNGPINRGNGVSVTSTSPSKGLGIIEAIHLQSTEESTTTLPHASDTATHEAAAFKLNLIEKYSQREFSKARLGPGCDAESCRPQRVAIPHLPDCSISPISESHLPSIRRLTSTTLPVRYGDAFFTTTLSDPVMRELCRVVLYASEPVGWIRCRLEPCSPNSSSTPALSQIYIQALALLSPYRGLGLATLLLDAVLSSAIARSQETVCIYAHVWEKNEDALDWYAKRGFKRVMLVERYYRKLMPGGAWIVRRELDGR